MGVRTTYADALHQAGRYEESLQAFREAESLQAKRQSKYPRLYSTPGFRYCDLLLFDTEQTAWRCFVLRFFSLEHGATTDGQPLETDEGQNIICNNACAEITERATKAMKIAEHHNWLLDIALDHLTLGRATLFGELLSQHDPLSFAQTREYLGAAVGGLRQAGTMHELPRGLLIRAWLRYMEGDEPGARADLDEAWQIAERGSMRLYMADVLLTRARLFRDRDTLVEAKKLVERCGYHRRDGEIADAEEAAKHW
jgi:tetratricopeptide (TPR) repeat protein